MSRFTVHWMKNWLKGKAQRVVANDVTSDYYPAVFLRVQL